MNTQKLPAVHLVLLSGPIAGGKSVAAEALLANNVFKRISTGGYLVRLAKERGINIGRTELQDLGDRLDLETDYYWPVTVAIEQIQSSPEVAYWLLDVEFRRKLIHLEQ